MRRIIIAWTPFNHFIFPFRDWKPGGETHPVLTREWIEKRFSIWKEYTYQSISNQSGKFAYFIFCNLLAKHITDDVFSEITEKDDRVRLIYFGDKTYLDAAKTVRKNYDDVFAMRIDSDDMYSRGTFKYIFDRYPAGKRYGYFQRGYGYNPATGQLWKYDCCGSGPFYVERFPAGCYRFDPIEHTVVKKGDAAVLEDRHFIVNVHAQNHSTRSTNKRFVGEILGQRKEIVLSRFGIGGRDEESID